jgi:nitroreductase
VSEAVTGLPIVDFETVLTTTRAVRRRLDFDRPVDEDVVLDCLRIALQAPTGGNAQDWRFVLIGDPEVRRRVAEVYRDCFEEYVARPLAAAGYAAPEVRGRLDTSPAAGRMLEGARYLAQNIGRAPWLLLACATRPDPSADPTASGTVSAVYGSIYPAVWSFCLALRSRGLGSIITTLHLNEAERVAEILGIPDEATQCCLLPVAHTVGLDFKPAPRRPLDEVVFRDSWGRAGG